MNFAIASERNKQNNRKNKKAVIWVSTVIYTLIGLSVMALLLAVIRPKIAEMKDSFVIKQTVSALSELDGIIVEIRQAVGNTREYVLYLSRGEFKVHCEEGTQYIEWSLPDSHYMFSEPSELSNPIWISVAGSIKGFTQKRGSLYAVTLRLNYGSDYGNLDLTFNGADKDKTLQPAKTAYSLWLENKGLNLAGKQQIDISLA